MKIEHCDICRKENAEVTRRLYIGKSQLPDSLAKEVKDRFVGYIIDVKPVENRAERHRDVEALCDDCFTIWLCAYLLGRKNVTPGAIARMLLDLDKEVVKP